jgi:uncharacterized repeat protein (TIGR03833 family)
LLNIILKSSGLSVFPTSGLKYMNGQNRSDIYPGLEVDIILKKDQRSGARTRGFVKDLLTSSAFHSRGIKVRLEDGQVGHVIEIIEED